MLPRDRPSEHGTSECKGILWIGGLIGVNRRKSFYADGEDRNADGEDGEE
jgi:hypothetical protein